MSALALCMEIAWRNGKLHPELEVGDKSGKGGVHNKLEEKRISACFAVRSGILGGVVHLPVCASRDLLTKKVEAIRYYE